MSAFQVNLTPSRMKNAKLQEVRTPIDVVMAPFSAKSIVQFDGVPITKTARRVLRIVNPTEDCIEVKVTKALNSDHNVSLSWSECVVAACSHVEMEMVWSPQLEVACMETLQLTDNRNFRKDVSVILKTKVSKPTRSVRKFPTVSSGMNAHAKTMRLKSPKGANKMGKPVFFNPQRKRSPLQNEKQMCAANAATHTHKPSTSAMLPKQKSISPLAERNVHVNPICPNVSSPTFSISLDVTDHKENLSPSTPLNMLSVLDRMKFTPVTETLSKAPHLLDLASLPTPVSCDYDIESLRKDIRPRRLTTAELSVCETSTVPAGSEVRVDMLNDTGSTSITVSSNKTFDVKRLENVSMDVSLNASAADAAAPVPESINRTTVMPCTPYSRALEMIREEDSFCSTSAELTKPKMDKTYDKPCYACSATSTTKSVINQNLKRDINLVGSPLRKYSGSMVELTIKSPSSSRICIQGSMPNLNEMESIQSIEQNRYFHQSSSSVHSNGQKTPRQGTPPTATRGAQQLNVSVELINDDELHLISNADAIFNKNEILAQSSVFNLHELCVNSRKTSPKKPWIHTTITLEHSPSNTANCDTKDLSNEKDTSGRKRKSFELSFSDSPSTDSLVDNSSVHNLKPPPKPFAMKISPPKRQRIDNEFSFTRPTAVCTPTNASAARNKSWAHVQQKKLKLSKTLSLVKKPITPRKVKDEPRVKLYDTDYYLQSCINPDPFSATMTCDPFLASTMYLDERAVDRHQTDFKKWLNALVSLPPELDTDSESRIDVGKLFNEVRHKQLQLAPTKEEQSLNYLTQFRLESLRRAAVQLYMSAEMRLPCSKVVVYVNKNALQIRSDRNLHLDVVMQRYILELLLCFSPLWLRLGLEVVYGEKIHLQSNSDIIGLSTFILNRLFRDKFLEQKYSKAYTLSDEYAAHIKKFTLQKTLLLLLFLDKAKEARIIPHNPCLFVKKSPYKETKEILLKFSSELLANIGDITRDLKRLGYVLQHKQTFLDEFNYAFSNIAVDLRDGVRLTRVMEVILLRDDLTRQLRVPAISRLQRVYNVNLALRALAEADFQLCGDIAATDIVDGHREKTLSLLWQIIYQFRSPKFHAAARTLQQWWRRHWLRVTIKRRIRQRIEQKRQQAAIRIQAAFRGFITRQYSKAFRAERTQAAVVLQKHFRRYRAQWQLQRTKAAATCIQRWYRSQRETRLCRLAFVRLRSCAVFVQRCYRRRLMSVKLLAVADLAMAARAERREAAACCLQRYWRARMEGQRTRLEFRRQRAAAITLQRHYRAKRAADQQRRAYCRMQQAALVVQRRFRARRLMRIQCQHYQLQYQLIVGLQRRWRATLAMRKERAAFARQRSAAISIQRRWRATITMRMVHSAYTAQRSAALVLQRRWRAMLQMRKERATYALQRSAALIVQRHWRATLAMRKARSTYLRQRSGAIIIQRRWRATLTMRTESLAYARLRSAAVSIQHHWRATLAMRKERTAYLRQRSAAVSIQHRWRATLVMQKERTAYALQRSAALNIQRHWRATLEMRKAHEAYSRQRSAAITIQRRWCATLAMRVERSHYARQRIAALVIQRQWRATLGMHMDRAKYVRQRSAAIIVQRRWRATIAMRKERTAYARQRSAAVVIQHYWRAKLRMREVRAAYLRQRSAALIIQHRWRATLTMRMDRAAYVRQWSAVVLIQRRWRATLGMRVDRARFAAYRDAALTLQRRWRAHKQMRYTRAKYQGMRAAVTCLQQRWRAHRQMQLQRAAYCRQREAAVRIQQYYRGILRMRQDRAAFERLREAAVRIQRHYRDILRMRQERAAYQRLRAAAVVLQQRYRAHLVARQVRAQYLLIRSLIVCVQRKYRARLEMQRCSARYQQLREGTLQFQTQARGYLARQRYRALLTPEMVELMRQKRAACVLQRCWRGYRVRKRLHDVRLALIRKNLAALRATSMAVNSIKHKLQYAVHFLRGRYNVAESLIVLMQLERLSRTVPHLLMEHSSFISSFCYGIMSQAIRSEVDKQMIEHCSCIILNLARYNSTTANTFQRGGLTTIAQMLLRWCDKDSNIFNTLCTLVWVFAHCPQKREIIRDFMTTTEAIFFMRETKKLVARKEKMDQNRQRNQRKNSFSSRALPGLEPDYGIICNRPYTFISSVYAFDVVLLKLGIKLY